VAAAVATDQQHGEGQVGLVGLANLCQSCRWRRRWEAANGQMSRQAREEWDEEFFNHCKNNLMIAVFIMAVGVFFL